MNTFISVLTIKIMKSFLLVILIFPLQVLAQSDSPPPGWTQRIKYIVGQDSLALAGYRQGVDLPPYRSPAKVPSGVTLYTAIDEDPEYNLRGFNGENWVHDSVELRTGHVNFNKTLKEDFPGAELSLGLQMQDCRDNTTIKAIGGITGPNGATQQQINTFRGYVDTLLGYLKDLERVVYLRIGYEFDGNWFCYDRNPSAYIAAFRYIHNRIEELDLDDRIATVWQTAAWPGEGLGDMATMYPGDAYVDYIGTSTFYGENFRTLQWSCNPAYGPNVDPGDTPAELRTKVVAFADTRDKPLMISEASPQGYDIENENDSDCVFNRLGSRTITSEQIWNDWYKDWFEFIHANSQIISHVAYINNDWQNGTDQGNWYCKDEDDKRCTRGYWGDSRLEADTLTRIRFNNELYNNDWVIGLNKGSANAETVSYAQGASRVWTFYVPLGASDLVIDIEGGYGDADLYVRYGEEPTLTQWDCRPYRAGNNERCSFATPEAGTYFIMLNAYDDYADVSFAADYEGGYSQQTEVPGVVTENAGAIANGETASWDVNVTQAGNLKLLISSTSSQNSQLIEVMFNGESIVQAIDAYGQHQTIEVYFSNVPSGANQISVKALSNHVSIGKLEVVTW